MSSTIVTALLSYTSDKIGAFNPQLLREWQGRLRWRNVLLTAVLSFVIQGLVLIQILTELPARTETSHRFCLKAFENANCQVGADGLPLINWPYVCAEVLQSLSFVLVWVLVVGGTYLLVADLSSETKRGTLNFLRMSPLSARQILLGKIMGVPVLLYLGLGVMCPMHLAMGLVAGYPLGLLLMFYGVLGAIAACFYVASLWFSILLQWLHGLQALLLSGISFFVLFLGWNSHCYQTTTDWFFLFNPLHILSSWLPQGLTTVRLSFFDFPTSYNNLKSLEWFFLPAGSHVMGFAVLSLINALVLGLWFWVVLERKFQTPTRTALGKRQSYCLTLCLSLMMLGFEMQGPSWGNSSAALEPFLGYVISMLIWCVVLLFLLLPSKQKLLDWARYRHQLLGTSSAVRESFGKGTRQRRQLADWMFHDDSPLVSAYVANLAIVAGGLLAGLITFAMGAQITVSDGLDICLSWFFMAAVMLVCALVLQLIALSNLLHWRWISLGAIATIIIGWPMALVMVGIESYRYSGLLVNLWLTTVAPLGVLDSASGSGILFAIAIQTILISTLSILLFRRCQILGQSEWKALMESRKGRSSVQS